MNPEVLRPFIRLPDDINPIEVLINDETRFLHELGKHNMIAWPGLEEEKEEIIRIIALAAGAVVNRRMVYHFFLDYMPDKRAKNLLESLLGKMDTLVETTFGKSTEEMQPLAQQRDKDRQVIDDILIAYSTLTSYLKPKTIE